MAVIQKTREGFRLIGKGIPRLDARDKVSGRTAYADDIHIPNLWHGYVVRAPVPHGKVRRLKRDDAFDWNQVVVVTPADIPGRNIVDAYTRDMPLLCENEIFHQGEPLALVAAPTRALAREAASHMHPEIEVLPALLTLEQLVAQHQADPSTLDRLGEAHIRKGDTRKGAGEAELVVEREYWCGHQEQMYIEPQGMTAVPLEDGRLLIEGSMQCPYFVHDELLAALALPPEKLVVRQSGVGGGFGGKEEFPTLVAGYCALLALKAKKPVRIILDRHEDILYSAKRHPTWFRHRTGLRKDGTITFIEIDIVMDGGGYTTLSQFVLGRCIAHAAMGYRCENVAVDATLYRTHTPPNGAFRGFGTPQALWGNESHIDELAEACGMAPDRFRLKNCLLKGDTTPTSGILREAVGSKAVLEDALQRSRFAEKFERCSRGRAGTAKWYGIGAALIYHGQGYLGDAEHEFEKVVVLELDFLEDGRPGARIRVAATEIGQGAHTVIPQVTAEGLSIPLERVSYPYPDTSFVPNSGGTHASRTTVVIGNALYTVAARLKKQLEIFAAETFFNGQTVELENGRFEPSWGGSSRTFEEVAELYLKQNGPLRMQGVYEAPATNWDWNTWQGDAHPTYAWGCNVAEVEVDPLTFEIRVTRITATYDVGRVINPVTCKGQAEGAMVQALGYALMEKMEVKDGKFDADRMQTYVIPTAMDIPELGVHFIEDFPYEPEPLGAKGAGEMPIDGLAAAIGNAIKQATGVRLNRLPMTPEQLYAARIGVRGQSAA